MRKERSWLCLQKGRIAYHSHTIPSSLPPSLLPPYLKQVVEDGYEFFARRQLVTIFSAVRPPSLYPSLPPSLPCLLVPSCAKICSTPAPRTYCFVCNIHPPLTLLSPHPSLPPSLPPSPSSPTTAGSSTTPAR